jgi:arsenite/tail-anchored protein-transporting ATPase
VKTPSFLSEPYLRLLLFGGKGGVGKTTCAMAAAIHLARNRPHESFLLVSTDPAHSLVDSIALTSPPENLKILELDAEGALAAFKTEHHEHLREIATRGTFLDEEDISKLLELSLPGLDELMAFTEISKWVENQTHSCIIVDTAPTGHTLRLLTMPALIQNWLRALDTLLAKHRYMKLVFRGSYRRDYLDHFLQEFSGTVSQMQTLMQDADHCRFIPVMLAEELSVRETASLLQFLQELRMPVVEILVNRLFPDNDCPVCREAASAQRTALKSIPKRIHFGDHPRWGIPLYPHEVSGIDRLVTFWDGTMELPRIPLKLPREATPRSKPNVEAAASGHSFQGLKLLFFAGKGGVGKTTLACATALRLAQESSGKELLLFSIDPAHSLSACLGVTIGPEPIRIAPGLSAVEFNAETEFDSLKEQYQTDLAHYLKAALPNFDLTFDREVLERILDLSPPGLDEIMALTRALEFFLQGRYELLIFDSAPTGHLIRLLELPQIINQWLKVFFGLLLKYRTVFSLPKISQRLVKMSKELKAFKGLLQDPTRSALFGVTILTEMAFQETVDLSAACKRLAVNVPLLFLNLVTPPAACSLCTALAKREEIVRNRLGQTFPELTQTVVYRQHEPRGLDALLGLGKALFHDQKRSMVHASTSLS